ncbi:MAG: hypothetical protein F4X99_07285 [Gammaproteobacteria bacterium]|nr:hypothetical protein [Gammaproteobacteria bacterium]
MAQRLGRFAPLILACVCLAGCWSMLPDGFLPDYARDTMVGMSLSDEEAEALEERLEHDPHDLSARAQLLSYYEHAQWRDDANVRRYGWHVVWLAHNDPRHTLLAFGQASIDPSRNPSAYARVKAIWLQHLSEAPRDTGLLAAAAASFERGPDIDLALALLERAQEIDPGNSLWPSRLGSLRWRIAQEDRERPDPALAAAALSDFERADELNRHGLGSMHLNSAMEAAFAAGQFEKARTGAAEGLAGGGMPFSLEPKYRANLMLGRIALAEDDPAAAADYLVAAGRVAAWPSLLPLLVWQPDMQLAEELLEQGEPQVVLEYLKLCALHWEGDQLREWADEIRAGGIPDLGQQYVPF